MLRSFTAEPLDYLTHARSWHDGALFDVKTPLLLALRVVHPEWFRQGSFYDLSLWAQACETRCCAAIQRLSRP